ncbi:1,4-alpha-glucan branching protein GlgB [Mucilaginibacter terrae]|uniref:1,4-alpha-glucan branching enzyme GlgB n=1 Tax=Mucilaginibacter terrae TaxID=1955052 RepID=A0ABU3GQK7_9SPHI|nr:1,4-alpha-glucan branching protein GlgB [Mucilaginibacter terrae]MDT3402069.1 1,4-alpha-glucan branching enzyme [Mucilaginibacter terrae]
MAKKFDKTKPATTKAGSKATIVPQPEAGIATFPESKPVKAAKSKKTKAEQPVQAFPESEPVKTVKPKATKAPKPAEASPEPVAIKEAKPKKQKGEPLVQEISIAEIKTAVEEKKQKAATKSKKTLLPVIPNTQSTDAVPETLNAVEPYSRFTDFDIDLFKGGKHFKLYEKLGSHVVTHKNVVGTYFAVWAPNAQYVSVTGNFNGWNKGSHGLNHRWDGSGIWEGFIPNIGNGEVYKYFIHSHNGEKLEKADPYALQLEQPPQTASVVANTYYEWKDQNWMQNRYSHNALDKPYSVYEVHLGSWARSTESPDSFLTYDQLADRLVPYVKKMGFTHVEFMPIMEHPFYPSWGYQVIGYFAATSRYGSPQQLMHLIERFHEEGIGVILDWVPSHFPGDAHALYHFDGTHLYEHEDVRKGYHPDWTSYIFNYGRNEVKSFLISSAIFWLERYHADGLRVDGVASMLYLDYSRKHGEWEPNYFGGNHNLEAIDFLKEFNMAVYSHFPDVQTIAEESTSFSGVTKPVYTGGLGFGMKWMMGWMHDSLDYFQLDPIYRKHHHNEITFSLIYSFTENFMLPFSHDEVVYGKQSMLCKMPGDEWQRYANLRLLYSYMFTHPGAKLLFMGGEFGQNSEWAFGKSLDWWVTQFAPHSGMQEAVKSLNNLYRTQPALYEKAFSPEGFEWIDGGNANDSILVYVRKGHYVEHNLVVVLNMTPNVHYDFRIGVPQEGQWHEIFNSDAKEYWGSGVNNPYPLTSEKKKWHGKEDSIKVTIPPLGAVVMALV